MSQEANSFFFFFRQCQSLHFRKPHATFGNTWMENETGASRRSAVDTVSCIYWKWFMLTADLFLPIWTLHSFCDLGKPPEPHTYWKSSKFWVFHFEISVQNLKWVNSWLWWYVCQSVCICVSDLKNKVLATGMWKTWAECKDLLYG